MVDNRLAVNLLDARASFSHLGYCTFSSTSWWGSGISICDLTKELLETTTYSSVNRHPKRSIIAGRLDGSGTLFLGKNEIHCADDRVTRDYCDALAGVHELQKLIKFLGEIPERHLMPPYQKFFVETITHRSSNIRGLPLHQDGASVLFFLILENSMLGGDLLIGKLKNKRFDALPIYCERGAAFYGVEDVDLLSEISCKGGSGYMIGESIGSHEGSLLHGCRGWITTPSTEGKRLCLRITFHFKSNHSS